VRGRQKRFTEQRDRRLSQISTPSGVKDPKSAQRELSSERGAPDKLKAFISRAEVLDRSVRATALQEQQQLLAQESHPKGVSFARRGARRSPANRGFGGIHF